MLFLCSKRSRARREGGNRGWDGWMASPPQWTLVWVRSGSWWWTGRPGMLHLMGLQRVGHGWATELRVTWTLVQEDILGKGMATHSSILAWTIPLTEEPGSLQSMGSQRVRHDWATELNWTELVELEEAFLLSKNLSFSTCKMKCKDAKSFLSCPTLFDPTDWSPPAPLSMEFSRQEYCSRLPCSAPGDLPNPGIKPRYPTLQADSLPSGPPCRENSRM